MSDMDTRSVVALSGREESRRFLRRSMLLFLILLMALFGETLSVTKTWDNGAGDQLWTSANNWSPDGVPGSADDVVFNSTSTASCFFSAASTTVASITFNSSYTGKFEMGYGSFGKGLRGMYFGDNGYTGGTFSRVDATVNFPSDWITQPSGIGSDTYRVVWTGHVLPQYSGTYTFYETSDDGARLWVNGTLVIDKWLNEGMVEYSGTISLNANELAEIKYEMYEELSGSGAILQWSHASLPKEVIPQSRLYPDRNGLRTTWWGNTNHTGTTGSSVVPFPDIDWGIYGPDEVFTNDDFSADMQGYIVPQYTETYTFYATKDDGVRLWVNNSLILDSYTCGCTEQTSATIDLVAGVPYFFDVDFSDTGGNADFHLSWSSASQPKQIIPQSRLYLTHVLAVTGNADFRSGGDLNFNMGTLHFSGSGAQTFIPKSGTTFGRIFQNGTGTTTITTNSLLVRLLRVQSGTFHLGSGLTVTPTHMYIDGGTVNFGTSNLVLSQPDISFSLASPATSGAAGSVLTLNGAISQIVTGNPTGADLDITISGNNNVLFSGNLNLGAGTLTKNGSGTLTLTGNNSGHTGPTVVNAGTLQINATSNVTYQSSSITNNATVNFYPSSLAAIDLRSQLRGSGTWNFDGPGGGSILENRILHRGHATASDNTGPINVINSGKLWFESTVGNSFCGPTTVVSVAASAVFAQVGTGTRTIGGLTGSGTVNNHYNLGSATLEVNNSANHTFSGQIKSDAASLALIKDGAGDLTLSGANTISGGVTVEAGELIAENATAFGTPAVTVTGGSVVAGSGITVANAVNVTTCNPGTGQGALEGPASGTGTFSGTITLSGNCSSGGHFMGGNNIGGLVVTGSVTRSGGGKAEVRDRTVTFSGGGSYDTLNTGAANVKLGAANGVPSGITLNLGTTGINSTFDLNGYAQTLAGIIQSNAGTAGTLKNTGAAATLTLNGTGTYTYPDSITGPITLSKTGSGTQTFSGSSNFSGATTVSGGTLIISGSLVGTQSMILRSGGNVNLSGTLTLATDSTGVFGVGYGATGTSTFTMTAGSLNIGNGGGRTFIGGGPDGGTMGTGVFTISGGTATVAAEGTFPNNRVFLAGYGGAGTVNLDGGVFLTSRNLTNGVGTSSTVNFNGGTLRAGFATSALLETSLNRVNVRNGGGTVDNNGNNITLPEAFQHSNVGGDNATDGGLTFSGTGTTILSSTSNAWTGPTTVSASSLLDLGVSGVIPDNSAVTVGGTLDMNGQSETIGSLAGGGGIENNSGTGTYTLTLGGDNSTVTFTGLIQDATGSIAITKTGTGGQVFTGNNSHSGAITLNGGYVRMDHANALGTGTITVNAGAYLQVWAPSAMTVTNSLVLNGSSGNTSYPTLNHDGGNGDVTWSGPISVTAASEIGMGGSTANDLIITGVISGSGNITIDEANGAVVNTLYLSAVNTFTGSLTITPGVVRLGVANAIPDLCPVTVNTGSTGGLDLYGQSETIGSLAGNGVVDNNNGVGTYTLTTGGDNTNTTFSGVIKNTSGTLALRKEGTGLMALSGVNTFTGNVTIHVGGLRIFAASGLGNATKTIVMTNGTAGQPSLRLDGSGGAIALPSTMAFQTSTSTGSWGGIINEAGDNSIAGSITLRTGGGSSRFRVDGGTLTISGNVMPDATGRAMILDGVGNGTFSGVLSDNGFPAVLRKEGTGTWTVSGANTYTSGTQLAKGTLQVSSAGNLGSPPGGNLVVFSDTSTLSTTGSWSTSMAFSLNDNARATFNVAAGQTLTANGTLHSINNAVIFKAGTGTLVLGGDNTQLDNDLYLDAGTLEITSAGALGNNNTSDYLYAAAGTTIKLTNSAAMTMTSSLQVNGTGVNLIVDRAAGGAGVTHSFHNLVINGAHTLNVTSGANTTSGTAGFTVANTTTLGGNSVLDVADPGTPDLLLTLTGAVGGAYSLTKNGTGFLTLSGNNTYTGATVLNAGKITLGHANALGTTAGGLTVASGATLDLNGNAVGAEAMSLTGAGLGSLGALVNGGAAASWAGDITLANPVYVGGSGDITLSGAVTTATLIKIGTHTLTLSGTTDNNNMSLTVNAGTALLAKASTSTVHAVGGNGVVLGGGTARLTGTGGDQIYNASDLTVTSGTFDLYGNSETVDEFSGAGTIDNTSGTGTYTLTAGGSTNTTFSGLLQNTTGTLAFTKTGTGILTLSGANTHAGTTTVSAGTLLLSHTSALGTTAAGTVVGSSASLDLNGQNYASAEALTLTGFGVSSTGALKNTNAAGATFGGLLTLGGATEIIGGTGSITLTHTGTITGDYNIDLGGAQGGSIAAAWGTNTGTLLKEDAGTWTLTGGSTRVGANTITGGTLRVTTTQGLGTGTITVNGGTMSFTIDGPGSNGTITLGNDFTINSGNTSTIHVANNGGANTGNTIAFDDFNLGVSTVNFTGANGYLLQYDSLYLGGGGAGTSVINPTTTSLTIAKMGNNNQSHTAQLDGTSTGNLVSGVMANGAQVLTVTKANSSTWTLAGANTYTGATSVNGGILSLTGSLASGSAVTVASGATLRGSGNAAGALTVQAGGILEPGVSSIATLSTGALTLASTSVINMTVGPFQDKIATTGNLTLDGTLNISLGTDFNYGIYPIMTYTGTLTNNTLDLATLPSGYYGTVTASGGTVYLNIVDHSGWNYATSIWFNTTSTGAGVSSNLTDFPVLIRLDSNNFYFEQAQPDGRDIRFTDRDGSPAYHEIERWDASAKRAEIWVRVPQVDGNSVQDYINFYWGNPSVPSLSNGANVFAASNSFKGVWHLEENGNTSAQGYQDASASGLHLTGAGGLTSASDVDGIVGRASSFNGSSDRMELDQQAVSGYPFTLSAWGKTSGTGIGSLVWIGDKDASDVFWAAQTQTTVARARARITGTDVYAEGAGNLNDGAWHHVAAVYASATDRKVYVDGVLVGTNTTSVAYNSAVDRMSLGRTGRSTPADYWNGAIDEARIENAGRSADWIKLAYQTQRPNSPAVVFPNTSLSNWPYNTKIYINTAATGANTTTDVSNFPVLVRLHRGNFDFSQARSDGGDLRFADSTGTLLAYQIERFDPSAKAAEIWVLIPTVKGANNSQWFRMYWGRMGATSLSSGPGVFKAAHNFVAVYHLNEDGNTAAGGYSDATGETGKGTGSGLTNTSDVDAAVGRGTTFNGSSTRITTGASSLLGNATSSLTFSAWVNGSSFPGTGRIFGASRNTTENGVSFGIGTGGNPLMTTWNVLDYVSSGHALATSSWYHVAIVLDAGFDAQVYVNGTWRQSIAHTAGANANTDDGYVIGANQSLGGAFDQYFNGVLDEVQVSNVIRSADFLRLSYEIQKPNSGVVTVGTRSGDFTTSLRLNFNTTSTGANVTGTDVANIPILVKLTGSNFDFSKARNDGADLQFIDRDGTWLYHDLAEWDPANKVGKVWVKVPQVDKNSLADYITLYYGCSGCATSNFAVADSVWSGHAAVFHLAAPETRAVDAGKNDYHGDYIQPQSLRGGVTSAAAPVFDGVNDYIQTTVPTTAGTRTFSAWIYPRSSDDVTYIESVIDGDVAGQHGTGFGLDNGVIKVVLDDQFWTTSQAVTLNVWQHVAVKFNATNAVVYYNGAPVATLGYTQGAISSTTLRIGRSAANAAYFDGALNEVQILDSYAGDDWIKLSYENQKEGSLLFSTAGITTASFNSSKVFKFNTTSGGANVAGDVFDFPLLLRFTDAALIDATQSAGQDIRFLDADGVTWLDYQIERWDQAANVGEIWVKVPKIDGNSASDFITMWYDDKNVTLADGQCASCVFGAGNGFVGAWHLSEDGSNTASAYQDASSGGRHGTGTNMSSGSDVAGQIGVASNFATASNQKITTTASGMHTDKALTIEAWVNTTSQGTYKRVVCKAFTTNTAPWNEFSLESGSTSSNYSFGANIAGSFQSVWTSTATSNGTWYHLAGTYDGSYFRIYHNGVEESSYYYPGTIMDYGTPVTIGAYQHDAGSNFDGKVDEPRVHHRARSADWIKLSYETQKSSPSLFNPNTTEFASNRRYVFNTTAQGANVRGDVENFPLLVRITGSAIVDAVRDDYDDIRFLDADGKTWLQYQVERWDKTKDSAEVWVLVPKVDGNSNTDHITLYYDDVVNDAVPNGECGSCVFSTADSWVAAWHLNTSGTGARPNAVTGGNSATPASYDNDEFKAGAGMIAGADSLDGTNDYLDIGDGYADFTGGITYSVWAYPTQTNAWQRFLDMGAGQGQDNFLFSYGGSGDHLVSHLYNGNSNVGDLWEPGQIAQNEWQHFAVTVNASNFMRLFKNGTVVDSLQASAGLANTARNSSFIGRSNWAGDAYYKGKVDEPQLSKTGRSVDWIKLSYETQRSAGNAFWNTLPNNRTTLTATTGNNAIALAWTLPVSDSATDSVGIWVKYSGPPTAANASGQSKVVILPKTDSAWSYPATYPGTYYFGLAVRGTSGTWSPITGAATDTVIHAGNDGMYDTVYVDSAIGNNGNSCDQARSPFTPRLTVESAISCQTNSINDTLVIRVMPGTYADNNLDPNTVPIVVESFDRNYRAVFNNAETRTDGSSHTATLFLRNDLTLRNVDVKAEVDGSVGIHLWSDDDRIRVDGVRIFNKDGATRHAKGIQFLANGTNHVHIANCLIHEPTLYGIHITADNSFNVVNNVFVGTGANGTKGIYKTGTTGWNDQTITNNIFLNWDWGFDSEENDMGVTSNNLFHQVTLNRETNVVADANKVVKDPLFASTSLSDRNAFKLLPGSPAIDAGTASYGSGGESVAYRANHDLFGAARPVGSAPDIGLYEGTGYTPGTSGDFDTLTNTVSGNTVIVKNGKWKLVWDMARGGGITQFYDMTVDSTANLLAGTSSLLFDVRLDASVASSATSNTIAPLFLERTRARSVVEQRLAVSASLDLVVHYTVHPSGHVHIQSNVVNLGGSTLDIDVVQYSAKVASATSVSLNSPAMANGSPSRKNGYGYLTRATRDVLLAATRDLDGEGWFSETWAQTGSVAGSLDSVGFSTADLADIPKNMRRQHHFLLYLGETSIDQGRASAIHADAANPGPVSMLAGTLLHERSWQDRLGGHWTFDEARDTVVKDWSINYSNHAMYVTSPAWVTGRVGAAVRFTNASAIQVQDHEALEVRRHFSVAFWFKPDFAASGSNASIITKGTSTSDGWYFKRLTGGNQIRFRVDAATADSPELTTGTWYHMAGVVGGSGTLTLYVNGVLVSASTADAVMAVNSSHLRIGENSGANDKYAGDIDDVRIYHTGLTAAQIQSLYHRGFNQKHGEYHLRADNNNRIVALLNEGTAATRVQPAFVVDNWFGSSRTPKYVYLNGIRLKPNVDFVSDSIRNASTTWDFGHSLLLQLNRTLTGADQTLFVDDNDSSGYLGQAAKMKSLAMSSVPNDKLVIQNFPGSTFGSATSGQWSLELDLNGWTTPNGTVDPTTGFGRFNSWKAASINPNLGISSAQELTGVRGLHGRSLFQMKFDATNSTNPMGDGGKGYAGPANIAYSLADSSATRLSLTLADMSITGDGSLTLRKRYTVYPTGRIFATFKLINITDAFNMDIPRIDFLGQYDAESNRVWSDATVLSTARTGRYLGGLLYHSYVGAMLGIKSAGSFTNSPGAMIGSANFIQANSSSTDTYSASEMLLQTGLFQGTDDTVTVTFFMDISRDFNDSASADSLARDIQTPATLLSLGSGSADSSDGLDQNGDGFAEGDGAYTYTTSSGLAKFKFTNTVTHFNPVFRFKSWSYSSLPEHVIVDNQTLVKDYHYNAFVNPATSTLIIQFNRTFKPGTHTFFISHKTGLAVTLNEFEAEGGEGVDTLRWTTQSEFENLGFHAWRRVAPVQALPDSLFTGGEREAGAGIANALMESVRSLAAAKAAAKLASAADTASDTLPSMELTEEDLKALGYVRITAKLIPGAKGGSSANPSAYEFIDRTAGFGTTYEYLLESVDFNGRREQFGPRSATPRNPMETALLPNYPNPFNPVTTLRFSLKEKARVSLLVYDAKGRLVRTLLRPDKPMLPGKYRLLWDAKDEKGFEVPSGHYFYRFVTPGYRKTRKMILLK